MQPDDTGISLERNPDAEIRYATASGASSLRRLAELPIKT
jgi:hypothetical protein